MRKLESKPGEHVDRFAIRLAEEAHRIGESVAGAFNEIEMTASPYEDPCNVAERWHLESNRRYEAYRASPEGQAAQKRQEEARQRAEASAAEGIKPFSLRDEASWKKAVDVNADPYGACRVRYAARWANLMEERMAGGKTVADVAEQAGRDADTEGITGFMYGAAVSMLSAVWTHGEALRRWHNLDTQLGHEGERANETGGVLNPAIFNIG